METILKVEGMDSEHCKKRVSEAILKLDGVKSIEVNIDEIKAVVQHDENVTFEMLKEAVEDIGYEVIN